MTTIRILPSCVQKLRYSEGDWSFFKFHNGSSIITSEKNARFVGMFWGEQWKLVSRRGYHAIKILLDGLRTKRTRECFPLICNSFGRKLSEWLWVPSFSCSANDTFDLSPLRAMPSAMETLHPLSIYCHSSKSKLSRCCPLKRQTHIRVDPKSVIEARVGKFSHSFPFLFVSSDGPPRNGKLADKMRQKEPRSKKSFLNSNLCCEGLVFIDATSHSILGENRLRPSSVVNVM